MLSGMGLRAFANQAIEGVEIGRSGITCYVSEVTEPSLRQTVGAAEERAFRVTRSMKRWNWRRACYYGGMGAFLFVPPLFGDVGKLYSIAACGAYVLCDLWLRKTRRGQTFREAAAEVFHQRWRRQVPPLLCLVALLSLLVWPAAYYYSVTGFPWHWIHGVVAIAAGLVFVWRVRRIEATKLR